MNKYLSDKLRVISFFSMIMVVFLHSYNSVMKSISETIILNKGYSLFIQDIFSQGITRIAVPLFFSISGYLFFLKKEGTLNEFILKFKKRIKTLAFPYLFWSFWGLLFYFILQIIPQSKPFFTNDLIRDYSINKLLYTIFINPIPYQLWFLRDLIVIIFMSPIIYWLIKYLKFITVLIFLIAWIFHINFKVFSNEALLFFAWGAYLSIYKNNLILRDLSTKYWIYTCIWIAIVFCKTTLVYIGFENAGLLDIMHKTSVLTGILSIWSLYDFLFKNKNVSNYNFYSLTSFSFFLYVFHEPVLMIFKKGLFYFMGKSEFVSISIYIIAPLLTILISIFIGYYFKRITPKFYGLITGGR